VAGNPELEEFRRNVEALRQDSRLSPHLTDAELLLTNLSIEDVEALMRFDAGYCFLMAAATLNRTSLKKGMQSAEAKIVAKKLRRAHVVRQSLPLTVQFGSVAMKAVSLRENDLARKRSGSIESLFRERLINDGIPILMSPPVRQVPGLLIGKRKPDGVFPDPVSGRPPKLYFEIKNVRRVSDDIQKRLYEIAEASVEMKVIYGDLRLRGLAVQTTKDVEANPKLRKRIREQITRSLPVVVVLLLCSKKEASKYREGAETFVDKVFFEEEIEDCLAYLKTAVKRLGF